MKGLIGPCVCCGKPTVRLSRVESNQAYSYFCESCHLSISTWTWQELVQHVMTVANTEAVAS